MTALAVILAAAVHPNSTLDQLLGWTRVLDNPNVPTGPDAHTLAVELAAAGHLPLHALTVTEQETVVDNLHDRGTPLADIAEILAAEPETIRAIRHRTQARRRAEARRERAA
jgi:hypothetical protein